ncbi:MAG: cupin, partial [Deltaproteobacteria bacterium]|nr:cupin [Deltaproteobacteria bacterium]
MTTHPPLAKRPLIALVALAAGSALWALFLWGQLLVMRAGGTAFCAAEGTVDCGSVWDSPFAVATHNLSGVPV